MKKLLSLIVVVLLLTNCEDSSVVGPILDDNSEGNYSAHKLADPNSHEVQLIVHGTAKFDPENGAGGVLARGKMYYPSTLSIGGKSHKVNIIRDFNPEPAVYKGSPKKSVVKRFEIVERTGKRVVSTEKVLFTGKYQIQFNANNTINEIIYSGNGKNNLLGSTFKATEKITFDENLYTKRNKLRKGISSPVFDSQLDGLVNKILTDAD